MAITLNVTFGGREPDNLSNAIITDRINNDPALTSLGFKFTNDNVNKRKMYLGTFPDKITKKRVGCGNTATGSGPTFDEKFISVDNMQVYLPFCADDFQGTIFDQLRRAGNDVNNLEGTQIETALVNGYAPVIAKDMKRIIYFGDTANASTDYNQTTGLWKRIFTGVAAADITRTQTLADAAMGTAGAALTVLSGLYFGANQDLQDVEENQKRFIVSASIYNNYLQSLANNNTLESSWSLLQNGTRALSYMGVPVVKESMWDRVIAADFSPGANPESPNRAIYVADGVINIDSDIALPDFTTEFWYDRDEDMNKLRTRYRLGIDYVDGDLIAVAY